MTRVLVVDDSRDFLDSVTDLLSVLMPDADVVSTTSAQDGLRMARELRPDAVMLDIRMPVIDGFEACGELKKDPATSDIPVLLITGNEIDTQTKVKGLRMGAEAFLSKPFDAAELVAQINVMLRIRKMTEDLQKERDSLEVKVRERTRELEAEIAERTRVALMLKASLEEKDALLREVHHRVKNNMQVVSSLLSLQAEQITDGPLLRVFAECGNRIRAMAMVHETLYRTGDFSRVDMGTYLDSLARNLFELYGAEGGAQVALETDLAGVELSIDSAVPCAMIMNELISNSLKHAFKGGASDYRISVSLKTSPGGVTLSVGDNGVGMPKGADTGDGRSVGLHLVRILTGQLDGRLEIHVNGGTCTTIEFQTS